MIFFNQDNHFKAILTGIGPHAAHEEAENKLER